MWGESSIRCGKYKEYKLNRLLNDRAGGLFRGVGERKESHPGIGKNGAGENLARIVKLFQDSN